MGRVFEKISREQFKKDFNNICEYNDISLPYRKTTNSAGYDFISCYDFKIEPGEIIKVPTGIKVKMESNEFFGIYVRSSMGFKYNIRLCNQVGIIDSDYYNNSDNEGHIWICLQNEGNSTFFVKKGDGYAQGIFQKYLLSDDDSSKKIRNGGLGSTDSLH